MATKFGRDIPKNLNDDFQVPNNYEECRRQWSRVRYGLIALRVLMDRPDGKTQWRCDLYRERLWQERELYDRLMELEQTTVVVKTKGQKQFPVLPPTPLDPRYAWSEAE